MTTTPAAPATNRPATDLPTGAGPVTVRRYWVEVQGARHTPERLLEYMLTHLDRVSPNLLARFTHEQGRMRAPQLGDTYHIQMLLLRPAYVRLEARSDLTVRLRTLRPHPESGWIEYRVHPQGPGHYRIEIESRVRSSNALDRAAYLLGVSFAQRLTWEITMRRVARASGGHVIRNGQSTEEHAWPLDPSFPRGTLR
ncbi:hypothetical protein [Deinococcus maricopensis]|uniref:DUF1990 domain-containing protein n=1 Tax=Deinococcus maricopensis (strain DSM 21211 / LMG 22137 / NRRL B-23946 / LB-34) TaxID=709986 RepID=E8U894_DEIML|nr:hypothetical protein [Deinococcus maricopensis]ADV67283.1 hypothetical protein Deima_1634 [Deinococcus maricopensis DSM 21211]